MTRSYVTYLYFGSHAGLCLCGVWCVAGCSLPLACLKEASDASNVMRGKRF